MNRTSRLQAVFLFLILLISLVQVPTAEACVAFAQTDTAGVGVVDLLGCGEGTTESDLTSIDVRVPPETVAGTLLIAAISVDGVENVSAEPGWIEIEELTGGNNDTTLAIYTRIAGPNEPDAFTFSWPGNERAYGFITAWEEASGVVSNRADDSGNPGGAPTAPAIDINNLNNVILRIAGWDDDDQVNNLNPVIQNTPANSTQYNITQDQSSGGGTSVSAAAAYHRYAGVGVPFDADEAEFDEGPNDEQWAAISIEIVQGTPGAETPGLVRSSLCPSAADLNLAGPLVFYEQCTEFLGPFNGNTVTINTPDNTATDDYMVAVINTDGDRTITPADGAWSAISATQADGISQGVFIKRILAGEAATQTFNISANDFRYAYIMRFSGASGSWLATGTNTGSNTQPVTPSLNIRVSNTLALYLVTADDDDVDVDREPIVPLDPSIDAITTDSARLSAGDISGLGAYENIASKATDTGTNTMSLLRTERWRSITVGVEPIEFRFSMPDTESSVCGFQRITLRATDGDGNPLTWFTGTVFINATNSANAEWFDAPGDNVNSIDGFGPFNNYTFAAGDAGELVFDYYNPDAGSVDFSVSFGSFSESDNDNYTPIATLNIIDCEYRISYAGDGPGGLPDDTMATCGFEVLTLELVDVNGAAATFFSATVEIDDGSIGNYSLNGGPDSNFFDLTANDGLAEYIFDIEIDGGGTTNQIVLNYSNTDSGASPLNFDITTQSGTVVSQGTDAGEDPDLTLLNCEIRLDVIDGSNESDVCSLADITVSITTSTGIVIQNYDGDVVITTSSTLGTWTKDAGDTGSGTLSPTVAGSATYTFDAGGDDLGNIDLELNHAFTGALTFTVSGTAGNGQVLSASVTPGAVETITIQDCQVQITTESATSDVCRNGQIITYTILDRNDVQASTFAGQITLRAEEIVAMAGTANFKGDWEVDGTLADPPDNPMQLDNLSAGNGVATLDFVAADGGEIELRYTNENTGDWQLQVLGAGMSYFAGSPPEIAVNPCQFFITYEGTNPTTPGVSDVCSVEAVTITLVDAVGTPITDADYTEQINLTTSGAGGGTWALTGTASDAYGALLDDTAEDGSALYTFSASPGTDDQGSVTLNYTSLTSGTRNLNVTDGPTSDLGTTDQDNDHNLTLDVCTFQIGYEGGGLGDTHSDASVSACSFQDVTFEVYDSQGNPATNFAGDIEISNDQNRGDWEIVSVSNPGNFSNGTADDGAATYTFESGDGGDIVLRFTALESNDYNFDVVNKIGALDGDIAVDSPAADPTLSVTSCLPSVTDFACTNSADSVTINIANNSSLNDRMVLAVSAVTSLVPLPTPTFNGVAMTQLRTQSITGTATSNTTEMWYILDANMPGGGAPGTGAGSYFGTITGATTAGGEWGYCFLYLEQVNNDVLPTFDGGNPTAGTLNSTAENDIVGDDGPPLDDPASDGTNSTTITTVENNTLVISIASNDETFYYNEVSPEPPMSNLFGNIGDSATVNPVGGVFVGSSGVSPIASAFTVDEVDTNRTPEATTHIVAGFEPKISGPPVATGYEPVKLFQTYSGNISYRAIGNTRRSSANGVGAGDLDGCEFVAPGTATYATLDLPDSGTNNVIAAYLYWSGSGSDGSDGNNGTTGTDASVTLEVPNGGMDVPVSVLTEELFIINNVGGSGVNDYFTGFKDITNTVIAAGEGPYGVKDLTVDAGSPWNGAGSFSGGGCAGGWAMVVVYENEYEQLRVINLFQGFQPFQNSAFTLVPRNFRMAEPNANTRKPNGQITHITIEGDPDLDNGDESLGLQEGPGLTTFNTLFTGLNPLQAEFNSTITRPLYELIADVDPDTPGNQTRWIFDTDQNPTAGAPGYQLDFPNLPGTFPPAASDDVLSDSWGLDVDTHYVSGWDMTNGAPDNLLYDFAVAKAEEITTRYSAGQDLVLLISEVISITNSDIADLEVTIAEGGEFKVGQQQNYTYSVTNNGDGGTGDGGYADGVVVLTDILPTGMTFDSAGDVSGTDWNCTVDTAIQPGPGAFTCTFDIAADYDGGVGGLDPGELKLGEVLPTLTATVRVGDSATFPALDNDVKNVVRMLYTDLPYTGPLPCTAATGVSPDPATCPKALQFDNVNDLQGGTIDINNIDDKDPLVNNNVDSVTTTVKGILTDLQIAKENNGVFEINSTASYTITVSNNGPDATTANFSITDNQPAGVTFTSVDAASDPNWDCIGPIVGNLSCNYTASLASPGEVDLILNVTTGGSEVTVFNTASVAAGSFNFDDFTENNVVTDQTDIVAPPASATDKFLLSVSEDGTTIGGQLFDSGDLVLYDPQVDTASMFFDEDGLDTPNITVDDINATHLLANGQIVLSPNGASSALDAMSGTINFGTDDLISYNPILESAELIFDGSLLFDDDGSAENIDAVYVLDNGNIVFSTVDNASWNAGALSWDKSDLILWTGDATNPGSGTMSLYLDGSASTVFNAADSVQVDAAYVLVDQADATAVDNTFWLSSGDEGATAGTVAGPVGNTFGQDDLIELTDPNSAIAASASSTGNLRFNGLLPLGTFSPVNGTRRLDAVHIIESAYFGHFAITESQAGSTCAPGKIKITKHLGLTHDPDTDYTGTIVITADHGAGTWSLDTGTGTLNNLYGGSLTNGQATYTFNGAENGEVTLNLSTGSPGTPVSFSVDVGVAQNVNDSLVRELEETSFTYNDQVTAVTYADLFGADVFSNNDGSTSWLTDWVDVDDDDASDTDNLPPFNGDGPLAGNIQISGGKLSITSNPTTAGGMPYNAPSVMRTADLTNFDVTEDVFLNFNYTYFDLSGTDAILVEASDDNGLNWTELDTIDGISGTNLGLPVPESYNISTIGGSIDNLNAGILAIRFTVSAGYTNASTFYLEDVEVATGTNDCGIGTISHYSVYIGGTLPNTAVPGNTGTSATNFNGISCVGSLITVQGHDNTDFPSAPGESITLRTDTSMGTWASVVSGGGAFNDVNLTDGVATYTFPPGETTAVFRFNYTNPAMDNDLVNFNIDSGFPVDVNEDPTLSVQLAGLVFYNETTPGNDFPNQIAGKPSNVGYSSADMMIQAVRTSDNNPQACAPLFEAGSILDFEFALECIDPANCATEQAGDDLGAYVDGVEISRVNNNSAGGITGVWGPLQDITFANQTSGDPGGPIPLRYNDAGQVELHARYQIQVDDDPDGLVRVGDYLESVSSPFNVRPFGLDIDFSDDRATNGQTNPAATSYAADHTGTVIGTAGVPFATTVSAVAWKSGDDANANGLPDENEDLSNNQVTRNYGRESTAGEYSVQVDLNQVVLPATGIGSIGTPANNEFLAAGFVAGNGENVGTVTFDEVGIIDLDARLIVLNSGGTADTFMGLNAGTDPGSVLVGSVRNVGRFIPNDFELTMGSIVSRPLANAQAKSIASSNFTYMGEEFGISAMLTARNGAMTPATTRNYVGDFAKLAVTDFTFDKFFAVDEITGPTDLSSRIAAAVSASGTRTLNWTLEANAATAGGEGTLGGNLIFNRQNLGGNDTPADGPFSMTIGVATQDSDSVPIVLDLDVPGFGGATDAATIGTENFRYGRLVIDNAFGSELTDVGDPNPLGVGFQIEYWDGSDFVLNTDDSSTTLFYDAGSNTGAGGDWRTRTFRYVQDTFTANLPQPDNDDDVEAGESFVEVDAVIGSSDVVTSFYRGRTEAVSGVDSDADDIADDSPFNVSAPGDGYDGTAIIEFDLSDLDLPFSLDFLSYDWRTPGEDEDETPDNDYTDNPRGLIEFGSYRGHDRVINWQEIYIGN